MAAIGSERVNGKVEPFTPEQAKTEKRNRLHPKMINAVNELLAEEYREGGTITIAQEKIIKRFLSKVPGMTRKIIFDEKHLDIEPAFEKAGWDVFYDKPGYNESGNSYFKFSKKK